MSSTRNTKMKIIIDCDPGIDDAQAIMIALSQEVDVLAITCTHGNVNVDQVTNSETQRLVQNVILKLEKTNINCVSVKPVMVKHP